MEGSSDGLGAWLFANEEPVSTAPWPEAALDLARGPVNLRTRRLEIAVHPGLLTGLSVEDYPLGQRSGHLAGDGMEPLFPQELLAGAANHAFNRYVQG